MKVAILNCSDIAKRRMIPAFKSVEGIEICCVMSRSEDKAREFAELFSIPKWTIDIEEIFKCKPDAAYISSPPSEHYAMIHECIKRGIHVICEKSLTTDQIHTENLIRFAKEKGVIIQENYAFIFHDQWKWMMKMIPELGDLTYINSGFEFPPRNKQTDFRYRSELGGGSLLDAGGYPIKAASMIMGQINLGDISGVTRVSSELNVDISGNVFFSDTDGVSAFLSWSFDAPYRCQLEIVGTKGVLKANRIFSPRADETVNVERLDEFGKSVEIREFKCDHFRELIIDFIRRIKEEDLTHYEEIYKQSNWQAYAKTISFRTIIK
jgi:predicted dehydrogenase